MAGLVFDLRDLAHKIEAVAEAHPCYGQVHAPVQQLVAHISAIARVEEVNRQQVQGEIEMKPEIKAGVRVFCKGIRSRGVVVDRWWNVCQVQYVCSHWPEMRHVKDLEAM